MSNEHRVIYRVKGSDQRAVCQVRRDRRVQVETSRLEEREFPAPLPKVNCISWNLPTHRSNETLMRGKQLLEMSFLVHFKTEAGNDLLVHPLCLDQYNIKQWYGGVEVAIDWLFYI